MENKPPWELTIRLIDGSDDRWQVTYTVPHVSGFFLGALPEAAAHSVGKDIRQCINLGLIEYSAVHTLYIEAQSAYLAWIVRHQDELS